MAFFFLVAGLEARREFDMGELRERRRLVLPLVVAAGGMAGEAKIAADVDSADLSGVSGTPTFFVNGKRHHGAFDI